MLAECYEQVKQVLALTGVPGALQVGAVRTEHGLVIFTLGAGRHAQQRVLLPTALGQLHELAQATSRAQRRDGRRQVRRREEAKEARSARF